MTTATTSRRPGVPSIAMIVASLAASIVISIGMDVILLSDEAAVPAQIAISAILFNLTVIMLSGVGCIIEWRRPGHAIGRLLMLSGPLYAFLGASWLTAGSLEPLVEPPVYRLLFRASSILSWPGVALIVGWIPLLFPTGTLPGPRWRIPVAILVILSGISLAALSAGYLAGGSEPTSPDALVNAISLELLALIVLAAAALVTRYRRGDRVERFQIRWFGAAVGICAIGFVGTVVQALVRTDGGPLLMSLVAYAGILALPIAIGIAVTRYRLYEIDRLISRTIGWALVTGVLAAVFVSAVVAFQALLARFTQGQTFAVAASTLVAFALFQPVRRRVQRAVDRRFDRARYDADQTVAAFTERLRNVVDLEAIGRQIVDTATTAVRPSSATVWLRGAGR